MDNLYCFGNEKNLSVCRFDGWGKNDCTKEEAAGVVCLTETTTTTTPAPTLPPRDEPVVIKKTILGVSIV